MNKLLIVFFILFLSVSTVFGQKNKINLDFLINISISTPLTAQDLIYSKLTKGLRSFDDVVLANEKDAYLQVEIIVVRASNLYFCSLLVKRSIKYKEIVGSIVAIEMMKEGYVNYKSSQFKEMKKKRIKDYTSTFAGKLLKGSLYEASNQRYYSVFTDSSLNSLVSRLVASINTNVLEPKRALIDEAYRETGLATKK